MIAVDIGHNQLITEVLRLLHYLIKFGYYEDFGEVDKLLPALLFLVDGRRDLPVNEADIRKLHRSFRVLLSFVCSNSTLLHFGKLKFSRF